MRKVVAKISQLIIYFFGRVWNLVLMWIRIYFARSVDKGDHALQFASGHMFRKDVNSNFTIEIYLDYLEKT